MRRGGDWSCQMMTQWIEHIEILHGLNVGSLWLIFSLTSSCYIVVIGKLPSEIQPEYN